MSKIAATDVAVRLQLAADGHSPDYASAFGPGGFGYTDQNFEVFLINVANRMRLDTPELVLDWRSVDIARALRMSVAVFLSYVDAFVSLRETQS